MSGKRFVLALTLACMVGQATASAVLGCIETDQVPSNSLVVPVELSSSNWNGVADCAVACSGKRYSFWQEEEAECRCANALGDVDYLPALSSGSLCPSSTTSIAQLRTPFRLQSCYASLSPMRRSISPAVSTASECLAHCSTHAYASLTRESAGVACTCFDEATFGERAACAAEETTVAVYRRGVSGHGRRKKTKAAEALANAGKDRKQAPMAVCDEGLSQCPGVGGRRCADWQSDVESCGGCTGLTPATVSLYPAGVNCAHLPGVESGKVSCQSAKCVIEECRVGWTLIRGTCIKTARRR